MNTDDEKFRSIINQPDMSALAADNSDKERLTHLLAAGYLACVLVGMPVALVVGWLTGEWLIVAIVYVAWHLMLFLGCVTVLTFADVRRKHPRSPR